MYIRLSLMTGYSYMIRQAVPDDAAIAVPLILGAIGHIAFVLSGTSDGPETTSILTDFFRQEDNRLSYQNTLVLEEDGVVVGLINLYDGSQARELDAPIDLDTLSVSPGCQRKGYGSKLIEAGCNRARSLGHQRMALLVETDAAAKRLYERLGFQADGTKCLAGEEYFHMVKSLG